MMKRSAKINNQTTGAPLPVLSEYFQDENGRREYVRNIFNRTAQNYDRVERMMALGLGARYRCQALQRAGLQAGMTVLDVAMGTGAVAREAVAIVANSGRVIGLDPSIGMLRQAQRSLAIPTLQGLGECIPCRDNQFDFLSMGYALRHLSDIELVFSEFFRVLKPGGTACLLEITLPKSRIGIVLLQFYMKRIVPLMIHLTTGHSDTALLFRYYWDTIKACIPPEAVLQALATARFERVERRAVLGIFSEYKAIKPA
jgi:demethylmenaquinone methyltransferase/2-methoxy-6-polyprenyl-1,4-benzoquinol methylase